MFLEEALVIFACVSSNGCSETSTEYFRRKPDVKEYIDQKGQRIRQYIGPTLVDTVGPMLFVVGGGTGTVHLHDHFNLQMNKQSATLVFSWSY
jgi:hypothetical protein